MAARRLELSAYTMNANVFATCEAGKRWGLGRSQQHTLSDIEISPIRFRCLHSHWHI